MKFNNSTIKNKHIKIIYEKQVVKTAEVIFSYHIDLDNYNQKINAILSNFGEGQKKRIQFHFNIPGINTDESSLKDLAEENIIISSYNTEEINSPISCWILLLKKYQVPVIHLNSNLLYATAKILQSIKNLNNKVIDFVNHHNNELPLSFIPHINHPPLFLFFNYTDKVLTFLDLIINLSSKMGYSRRDFMQIFYGFCAQICDIAAPTDLENIFDLNSMVKSHNNTLTLTNNQFIKQTHDVAQGEYDINIDLIAPLNKGDKILVLVKNKDIEPEQLATDLGLPLHKNKKSPYFIFNNEKTSQKLFIPENINNIEVLIKNIKGQDVHVKDLTVVRCEKAEVSP